ncbi:MAG: ROK family protein [Sphingobacteriaceae bacterium]|nr:MAG: ROK family protein [Sphingobacteriaceae bacterium]
MDKEISFNSNNYFNILQSLYFNNILSILDISRLTNSSVPTTTKNVQELILGGYITEKGTGNSNGGRKPALYSLVKNKTFIVSVAIDQFYTKLVIADFQGNFITQVVEIELDIKNDSSPVEKLIHHINTIITVSGINKTSFSGVGISMPGFIDVEKGINYSFLSSRNTRLRERLSLELDLPVYIDNDSSAIALAELKFGRGKVNKEIMVVNIGWGIGLGMIVKGEIFRGFSGFAGELSHIPLFNNNKLCSCGKRGCLETEASLITLEDNAIDAIEKGQITSIVPQNNKVTIASIIDEALKGDSYAIKLISESAYHIGRAVAVLIHLVNPQTIVLGGKGIRAGKLWLAPVQQALNEFCIPTLINNTEVVLSQLGCEAQLIGSAALVIENLDKSFFKIENQSIEFTKSN